MGCGLAGAVDDPDMVQHQDGSPLDDVGLGWSSGDAAEATHL